MGGGRAISTAAKVAGIGVAKAGFKGGFGYQAGDQFRVTNAAAAASKPVSASISTAVHPSVEGDVSRPVWDDWEFAGVDEEPIPRVVFRKPPTLEEAKEATEDLKEAIDMVYMSSSKPSAVEGASVSRMLSNFQSSDKRAIESSTAVPQVALQAFAFLSESTAAQSVVASIASDPKVWDAVMENKDLRKFLQTNNTVEADNDDKSELLSTTESEERPIDLLEILQDMKLKVVRLMENVSSYFGGLFGVKEEEEEEEEEEEGKEKKYNFFNDPKSLFGLAVVIMFMVVMKRS